MQAKGIELHAHAKELEFHSRQWIVSFFDHASQTVFIVISAVALCFGLLVYLWARSSSVYFIPDSSWGWVAHDVIHLPFSGQLPGFLHTLGLVLMTYVILGGEPFRSQGTAIFTWVALEWMFEIGQHPLVAEAIANLTPAEYNDHPPLNLVDRYFTSGVFDPWDLLAVVLACGVVAWIMQIVQIKEVHHD
jgi:hypothetical protein